MNRIAVNAKLGDGSITNTEGKNTNTTITFYSKLLDWIDFKWRYCNKYYTVSRIKKQKSGYTGKNNIFKFRVNVSEDFNKVYYKPLEEVLNQINKVDLIMWYLDDGSYHKSKNTMHLYSNMLNKEESEILINRITNLYGIDPRLRIDKKKDGREYYYLYFRRDMVRKFIPEVEKFIKIFNVPSMMYKIGK